MSQVIDFFIGFAAGVVFMLIMNWNAWWWYEGMTRQGVFRRGKE